jgi:hypothetical protein
MRPLAAAAQGLNRTDAFINLQHDGKVYFGSNVRVTGVAKSGDAIGTGSSIIVEVDLSGLAAGASATLAFDLL